MHILLIHQAFAALDEAGGTRHHELALSLVERGHRVTVITSPVHPDATKAPATASATVSVWRSRPMARIPLVGWSDAIDPVMSHLMTCYSGLASYERITRYCQVARFGRYAAHRRVAKPRSRVPRCPLT